MSWIARSAAITVLALTGALLVAAPASAAGVPDVTGTGTTGSVELTADLAAGETSTPKTYGLGKPVTTKLGEWEWTPGGHSGISSEPGNIVASGQVFTASQAVLQFVVTSGDPSVELGVDVTWVEQGDLNPYSYPRVDTPGTVDTFQALPLYGLWIVDVWQLSGGSGVPVDLVAITAPQEAPLALDPAQVDAASPTVTASWSGLDEDSTYVGLVQFGSGKTSLVEIETGGDTAEPVATTLTSALSSSIQLKGKSTSVLAAVKAADGRAVSGGAVRVKVDGVVRASAPVTTGTPAVRVPLGQLPRGLHRIQVEYVPGDGALAPSTGSVLRLYAR